MLVLHSMMAASKRNALIQKKQNNAPVRLFCVLSYFLAKINNTSPIGMLELAQERKLSYALW